MTGGVVTIGYEHRTLNEFVSALASEGRAAPPDDPQSCCQCEEVVTEFGCQGLELDLPIVCWGEDHR